MKSNLFFIALAIVYIISFSLFLNRVEERSNQPVINSEHSQEEITKHKM
jgi:hypothetical protein